MNKNFIKYFAIWLVFIIAFNAVIFAFPTTIDGKTIMDIVRVSSVLRGGESLSGLEDYLVDLANYLMNSGNKEMVLSKYGGSFWPGYIFVNIAFFVNLFCAYVAFKKENAKKFFYSLPLITISYSGLITMFIVAIATMLIIDLSPWIGLGVCLIVLALNLIALFKASWAGEAVESIDTKVQTSTAFIKSITADAQGLMARAKTDEAKALCKKVYEAIRYSDPMSNDELKVTEAKMTIKMEELMEALEKDDNDEINKLGNALLALVDDRNRKVKALKH